MNQKKNSKYIPLILFILPLLILSSKEEVYASTNSEIQIIGELKERDIDMLPNLPDEEKESNKLGNKETIIKDLPTTGERLSVKMNIIGIVCILLLLIIKFRSIKKKATI